jgi:hypothetical protein
MEKFVSNEIGQRPNGTRIFRNYFMNGPTENLLVKAQHHFTPHEKKVAKLKYKNNK